MTLGLQTWTHFSLRIAYQIVDSSSRHPEQPDSRWPAQDRLPIPPARSSACASAPQCGLSMMLVLEGTSGLVFIYE